MKITLDYRNPTPSHCDVAVFINGALTGVLKLRQDELDVFQFIVTNGMDDKRDQCLGTGDPGPWPTGQQMRERIDDLEALLRELQNARPLLLYGEQWLQRINEALERPA